METTARTAMTICPRWVRPGNRRTSRRSARTRPGPPPSSRRTDPWSGARPSRDSSGPARCGTSRAPPGRIRGHPPRAPCDGTRGACWKVLWARVHPTAARLPAGVDAGGADASSIRDQLTGGSGSAWTGVTVAPDRFSFDLPLRTAVGLVRRRDQRLQGFGHLRRGGEAVVRANRQESIDDPDQADGDAGSDVRDRDVPLADSLDSRSSLVTPGKAYSPVSSRYIVQPRLKRSVRASTGLSVTCSGDMKSVVPTTTPSSVSKTLPGCPAFPTSSPQPRSSTLTAPVSTRNKLVGLTSRWMTPFSCAWARPRRGLRHVVR